jgi:vacuolar-type H+-ATPase subunit E/Vma4
MAELEEGQGELIQGIREDAKRESERLLEEARQAAGQRRQLVEEQAAQVLQEAEQKADQQGKAIWRQSVSALRMEEKRMGLRVREQVISRIEAEVRRRLRAMMQRPEYREVLLGWVVEAAIGLAVPEASVNVSGPERGFLDEGLLRQAEAEVQGMTGSRVKLSLSERPPLSAQGVVLIAAGGRLEFNNQVSTRLMRLQSQIRKLIYAELFG